MVKAVSPLMRGLQPPGRGQFKPDKHAGRGMFEPPMPPLQFTVERLRVLVEQRPCKPGPAYTDAISCPQGRVAEE